MKKFADFTVRPLSLGEASSAALIEKECLGAEAWSAEGISETLKRNGCYFAAVSNGQLLGHAGFTYVLDEGYITNIAVKPEFRRCGIASALTAALLEKGIELRLSFLTLEVRESNSAATALYEKHGFKPVGQRRAFYRDPLENAILMTYFFKEV